MNIITVKETKNQWKNPQFTLLVDDEVVSFNHYGSRRLTDTVHEDGSGIFDTEEAIVDFKRQDTWVTVDFGSVWDIKDYNDPAREIKRRIQLVEKAFEAVSETYEKVWTVKLSEDNDYIKKRIEEASQATHYNDGLHQYEIDNCYEDDDGEGNPCFRVISADGDTHLIAFCDIAQEAYFLKLTRIN